ncbi:flagellar biosynthetic protein FliO [Fictibacillus phosphorivorans]|uniref:flagellar biosynthetic protein FliO n=1 Tax=Fictibacillus phosphorivorans TaxID=1221500 RepID=UPI002040EE8B|nr:flagellar biosynthetic protein FliO [Fictibacillus phosphorivorans]MCM3717147.1 flagellar biosynthetic protein FliO [Fictibacillus phosphorivorans]MCM3774834.1 flagellar biosynthetic protein FliO [Fictibacillus phosphorivorans]
MWKWVICLFTAVCLSFVPYSVQAEGSGQGKTVWDTVNDTKKDKNTDKEGTLETKESVKNESTFFILIKLIFMLGIVLVILFFVLRFIQRKSVSFQDGKNLQSLGGIGVGQNRSVQLIKTGNSVLVVGVGDTVTLLKEIKDEEEVRLMLEQRPAQQVSTMANQLKTKWHKHMGSSQKTEDVPQNQKTNFKNLLATLTNERKEQRNEIQKAFEDGKHHE